MSDRARLFVALPLPAAVREELAAWRDRALSGIAGLRPVAPESMHVTLCFLGWRPADEIEAIAAALGAPGAAGRPALALGEPAWLPARRPHVLAVGLLDDSGALGALQAAVARGLQDGGWYAPEARGFRAHVTVARVTRGARVRGVTLGTPSPLSFEASSVRLLRSRLGAGGARYETLAEVPLA